MAERQLAANWDEIRGDHQGRYMLAGRLVSGAVLDAACGCGYGTHYMAQRGHKVMGIDISPAAIEYATNNWLHLNAMYKLGTVTQWQGHFDWVVSFETLEHITEPEARQALTYFDADNLIASVPNEAVLPFDAKRFPYHCRHYTPDQFSELLESAGWKVDAKYCQKTAHGTDISRGTDGRTLVYACSR